MERTWNKEDRLFVAENHLKMSDKEMAIVLKRSIRSIQSKRNKIGYKRKRFSKVTKYNLDFIRNNYLDMTDLQMSKELGLSRHTISFYRLTILGIHKMNSARNISYKLKAKTELEALKSYNYNGIMKESVEHRIAFLAGIVEGK